MTTLNLVGVEDGSFEPFSSGAWAYLCAASTLGNEIEEIKIGRVAVDGTEATTTLIEMLHHVMCDAVILGGVTFAGFNVVNMLKLRDVLKVPIVAFSAKKPDSASVLAALKSHFFDWEARWSAIEGLEGVHKVYVEANRQPIYYEVVGESSEWASEMLIKAVGISRKPECVRVAGIIAKGLGDCAPPSS